MPRKSAVNPHVEGSNEAQLWSLEREEAKAKAKARREELDARGERNVTVPVTMDAIKAAKALGTLAGENYKVVLAQAASRGVESLVQQVQDRLNPDRPL